MSEVPFFSVIVPTYNRSHSVVEAIESALAQTFEDLELLVIDDGSTDNTRFLIEPFTKKDSRVTYIYQENAERSAARNHGIQLAKGQYICFLDSDDLYLPDHLLQFRKAIEINEFPVAMFVSNVVYPTENSFTEVGQFVTDTNDPMELVVKTPICSQQMCIHNQILQEEQFNTNIRIGEDQELWTRILKKHTLIKSNQATVVIRDLGDRTIDFTKIDNHIANLNLKKLLIKADKDNRIRPEWRRFMLSGAYFKLATAHLHRDEKGAFFWNMLCSFVVSPTHYWKDKVLVVFSALPLLNKFTKGKL